MENRMNWKKLMCAERIRPYHNPSSTDLRTEFEKDYHRIISSASFRRMQDKTQVFPLDQSDFVRTRLTHSLEVSSFAKSLGQNVANRMLKEHIDPDFTEQTKNDICDVLQCAGLLHDIGNPSFGHFGESAIQDWFRDNLKHLYFQGKSLEELFSEQMKQDFFHFEGNTQAFRIVTKLHFLVDENGMNLTKALLGTIMKYPGSSLEIGYDRKDPDRDIRHKKMGFFYADREQYRNVQESNGTNGYRHPLSFLLEAADDIAYKTADIEDALKKGLLSYEKLKEELTVRLDSMKIRQFMGEVAQEKVAAYEKLLGKLQDKYELAIQKNYENPALYAVQNWLVRVQGAMLGETADVFIAHYEELMHGQLKQDLISFTSLSELMEALSDIAYRYAFVSAPILKLEVAADTIYDFLLKRFTKAFLYYDTDLWKERATAVDTKLVMLLSGNYKRTYQYYSEGRDEIEKLYLRMLLVTDYLCGMTDGFAKRLYQELNGISID